MASVAPPSPVLDPALAGSYAASLQRQKHLLPELPQITITLENVARIEQVPVDDPGFETVGSKFLSTLSCKSTSTKEFSRLNNATATFRPGTMTLILAPPGHGRSSLLKTLAGRLAPTAGTVKWNGWTKEQALEAGLRIDKLVAFVDQNDNHNPLLTVTETFQFAVDHTVVPPQEYTPADAPHLEELKQIYANKVKTTIDLLGLDECKDTIVGNDLLRGVSGGQKKRVTLGEMLLTDARVLLLDEVTNGLDSATAFDIFRALKHYCQIMGATLVTGLQQPTPELYELFDQIVLLKEGSIVYSGPRKSVIPYWESVGFSCPADQDYCDFMVELMFYPKIVYYRTLQRKASQLAMESKEEEKKYDNPLSAASANTGGNGVWLSVRPNNTNSQGVELTPITTTTTSSVLPPFTTREMVERWKASPDFKQQQQLISDYLQQPKVNPLVSDYAKKQWGVEYVHPASHHTALCIGRQKTLNSRNKGLIGPRIGQAIFVSLMLGSLFWQKGRDDYANRLALILFLITNATYGNMVELPIAAEAKRVLYKQTDAGFFPTSSYVFAVTVMHFPLAIIETLIFGTIVYFMTNFANEAGAYFIYISIALCTNFCMSVYFRTLSFVTPNEDLAQALAGPSTGIMMIFGGFFLTYDKVPNFMIWLYWLSPFSWSTRALAINEFSTSRYNPIVTAADGSLIRLGDQYLKFWGFKTETYWIWVGALVLLSYFFVLVFVAIWVLNNKRFELSRGTKRFDQEDDEKDTVSSPANGNNTNNSNAVAITIKQQPSKTSSSLPFQPTTLAFTGIKYTVTLPDGKKRQLLAGVDGFALPGELTALMGASGAGKTTLMDVIAGRKTDGAIEGQILVNGKPKKAGPFARISGYVEQTDLHIATATVRETLQFAAALRLPASVDEEHRLKYVQEVMDMLELNDIADHLIGSAIIPGLSPGQLKRVTIGVELVANPAILFADEPTTGLDSRSAFTVMRLLKKVAASGRSVVCTIHQPSAELFFMFDNLLLLAPGGIEVFFGPIGRRANDLVRYLEDVSGKQRPRRMNPASWMLDVLGASSAGGDGKQEQDQHSEIPVDMLSPVAHPQSPKDNKNFAQSYRDSALWSSMSQRLQEVCKPPLMSAPSSSDGKQSDSNANTDDFVATYATGMGTQFRELFIRQARSHWRNIPYNWNRHFVLVVLSCIFGLVYFDINDNDYSGVISKMSVMFVTSQFNGIINCATGLAAIIEQRAVFYREQASNTYSSLPYSLVLGLIEIPWVAFGCFIFLIPYFFLVNLDSSDNRFGYYYFPHFLLSLLYSWWSQLLTSVLPNKIVAGIVQGMFFSFFFLFGGIVIPKNDIPSGWRWFYTILPMKNSLEALVMPQFNCSPLPSCSPSILVPTSTGVVPEPKAYFLSGYLGLALDNYWTQIGYLFIFLVVIRVIISLALWKIKHIKR